MLLFTWVWQKEREVYTAWKSTCHDLFLNIFNRWPRGEKGTFFTRMLYRTLLLLLFEPDLFIFVFGLWVWLKLGHFQWPLMAITVIHGITSYGIKKYQTKEKIRNNYLKAGDNGNNKTGGGGVSEVYGSLTWATNVEWGNISIILVRPLRKRDLVASNPFSFEKEVT